MGGGSVANSPGHLGKSIGAVLAGFFAGFAFTTIVDVALHLLKVYPPWNETLGNGGALLATAYRVIFNIAGCYIAARLAPNRPMFHAMVIGVFGFVLSGVVTVATWNHLPPLGPHWYSVVVTLISLPCAWAGGAFYLSRKI